MYEDDTGRLNASGCPDPTYTYITQFQSNAYLYETCIRP